MVLWNVHYRRTHPIRGEESVLYLFPAGKLSKKLEALAQKEPNFKLERIEYSYPGKLCFYK